MKNKCSYNSIKQLKLSGLLGSQKKTVLNAFKSTKRKDYTAREAWVYCEGMTLQSVRSRATELERDGLLHKTGTRYEGRPLREVSTWAWTGLAVPVQKESVLIPCDKCWGRGKYRREVPLNPAQGRLEFVE